MNGLCLHSGSEVVTLDQVRAVPVPAPTRSWRPVAYGQAIDYLKGQIASQLGLEIESEGYGLNKAGDQLFALMTMKTDREDNGLSIGLRQSYNKSLSLGVAVGASVFVCDNLCFSGSAFKVVRKNTVNVWADFRALVAGQVAQSFAHYEAVNREVDTMRGIPCPERRGYAILGVAMGEGVLTPTQATVAFEDWKSPRHEDFADRNLYSLYNCATEGLKKGAPARMLDRHARAHGFFTEMQGI
jgi:hypothetical protein